MKNKRSFTLIELLVVIAVLAGFMALLVPNYMEVRKKSRDVRRKSDLRGIQKALELYKQNQSLPIYPAALTTCASLSDANAVYMQKIPQDPLSQCGAGVVSYHYLRGAVDFGKFTLCACLENINDSEGLMTCTNSSGASAEAPACSNGKYYQLNEP